MAEPVLKRAGAHLTTSLADIITVSASKSARIVSIVAANVDGTNSATVDVLWTDDANADEPYYIAKTVPVAADDSASILPADMLLNAGDRIRALASAASDIDLTVSYWEVDA